MSIADYQMKKMLAKLNRLEQFPEEAAEEVGGLVKDFVLATIENTQDPDTKKVWKKNLTGEKSLQTAGKSLNLTVFQNQILVTLPYYLALHNNGAATGKIQRKILPSKSIPSDLTKAIVKKLSKIFENITNS